MSCQSCALLAAALVFLTAVPGATGARIRRNSPARLGEADTVQAEVPDAVARKYCFTVHPKDCQAVVAENEAACAKWDAAVASGSESERNRAVFGGGLKCEKYRNTLLDMQEALEKTPRRDIAKASEACGSAVLKVCEQALCPTQNNINHNTTTDCVEQCKAVAATMFKTGEMNCDPKKPFAECMAQLHTSLKVQGRNPALEAIMREHTVKCMCVSWRPESTRGVCYEGGMGITPGTKWCEFEKSPSWATQLAKLKDEPPAAYIKPECEEFPYKNVD